jgi:hypothetical protein
MYALQFNESKGSILQWFPRCILNARLPASASLVTVTKAPSPFPTLQEPCTEAGKVPVKHLAISVISVLSKYCIYLRLYIICIRRLFAPGVGLTQAQSHVWAVLIGRGHQVRSHPGNPDRERDEGFSPQLLLSERAAPK